MSEFATLTTLLGHWPNSDTATPFRDSCLERVRLALLALQRTPAQVGKGDLCGLIAHALRRESARGNASAQLRVPRDADTWPDEQDWRNAGLNLVSKEANAYRLGVGGAWQPDWLPDSETHPPLAPVLAERQCRNDDPNVRPPLDPCLAEVLGHQFDTFTGPGQCQAVRSVFLLPPKKSVLVLLPTGAGKSLVAWSSALLAWPARGLTLVVVPTVALALDQEQQLRPHLVKLGHRLRAPLAWHGGLEEDDRRSVRQAIRAGTQPVLFASPEGVLRGLSPALFDAAKAGLLRMLVVDEAHMISQWGTDFRPEFQTLAGVRRELVKVCPEHAPFRTVLLTATLTADSYATLAQLYAPLELIAAVHLRPEPSYWVAKADSLEQKRAWVLEACRQLPRPFLLYVSRTRDAEYWADQLRKAGMRRVRHMHGKSHDREEVLALWRANAIDVVVATSAFGLGMDKRDVRAVLHACVPETLDRFYQEVGRGGRDGKACLSLLIYTDRDRDDASRLNKERVISVELGLERWTALLDTQPAHQKSDEVFTLDLSARRPSVEKDSEANESWNLQTLNLMARAKLIELHGARPPKLTQAAGESDADFERRKDRAFEAYFTSTRVEILHPRHNDRATWKTDIQKERERTRDASQLQLDLLDELLGAETEFGSLFVQAYTLDGANASPPETLCAGCPICRRDGNDRTGYRVPQAYLPERDETEPELDEDLQRLRSAAGGRSGLTLAVVTYPEPGTSRRARRRWSDTILSVLLPRCVELGIGELCVSEEWAKQSAFANLYQVSPKRYVLYTPLGQSPSEEDWYVPRLTLLDPTPEPAVLSRDLLYLDRPLHVLVVPEDALDPTRPGSRYTERRFTTSLESLLNGLER